MPDTIGGPGGTSEGIGKPYLADVVFVVDASASMQPCISNLVQNLHALVAEIEKGEGNTSSGVRARVDWRIGVVAHQSDASGGIRLWKVDLTSDTERVRNALAQLVKLVDNDEASPQAIDWAMDRMQWRRDANRRVLAVFTDEPVNGGDTTGLDEASVRSFVEKLHDFTVFLVAPLEDEGTPFGWKTLAPKDTRVAGKSFVRGRQHVGNENDWALIDFNELTGRLAKTVTKTGPAGKDRTVARKDVFGVQEQCVVLEL